MISKGIALQRLSQQRLTGGPLAEPADVIAWLGAVQAQDYAGAKWALALRLRDATEAAIDQAFNDGAILRTHVLRPTCHFVSPADIRWMLALTAPRVKGLCAYYFRQQDLNDSLFARSNEVIAGALQGCRQMTRLELGLALAEVGIHANGLRLIYILQRAELDGVICSWPRRGKQFTYMLLDERVPPAPGLSREGALAELTRRYFTGHGPASVTDFAWWSGLTMADAKTGLDLAADRLSTREIDGRTYWFSLGGAVPQDGASRPPDEPPVALLLPTFDEFLVGFEAFDATRKGGQAGLELNPYSSTLVIEGQVAGSWLRSLKKTIVELRLAPFTRLTPAAVGAVEMAVGRYGAFLGKAVDLVIQ